MTKEETLNVVNKIFKSVFDKDNIFSLEEILEKFAFDIKLPNKVIDATTGEETWAASSGSTRFITNDNMMTKDNTTGWMLPKKTISSLEELIKIWSEINLTTTERVYDSINVSESDPIYNCENVYRSTNCGSSKNIVYCDSCHESEYLIACQRSATCNFCIRTDDSKNCTNSYNVICSNKVSNSLFIQDCSDLYECIFCSHISAKKYCIANMQFTEEEYYEIKKAIVTWILSS